MDGNLFQWWISIAQSLTIALIVGSVKWLGGINTRMGQLETWAKGHETLDTARHDEVIRRLQ